MNKKEAKDLFDELIEKNECLEWGLTRKYIYRPYSIEQISPTEFTIQIERHPHLFGRASIGSSSSAFATVNQTFHLETTTPKVALLNEKVIDTEINYYSLAAQDFSEEFDDWWLQDDEKIELERLETEEEVENFVTALSNKIDFAKINEDIYITDYELPENFFSELIEVQKETLIDKVIEKWEYLKRHGLSE